MKSDYLVELTYELRQRGMSEATVVEIIAELPAQTPEQLRSEFGTPKEYASSFPKGSKRTAGFYIIGFAVVLSAAVILWRVFSVMTRTVDANIFISIGILVGALILIAVASVVAGIVDRRKVRAHS